MEHLPLGVLSGVIEALQWSYDELKWWHLQKMIQIYIIKLMGSLALLPHHDHQGQLQMYVLQQISTELPINFQVFKHKMFWFNLKTT